jgi:hypothetical protein
MTPDAILHSCITATAIAALYQFGVIPVLGFRGFVAHCFGIAAYLLLRRTVAR